MRAGGRTAGGHSWFSLEVQGFCWPYRSAQGPLLGAPEPGEGGNSHEQCFAILTVWLWMKLSQRGSELTISGSMQTALEGP